MHCAAYVLLFSTLPLPLLAQTWSRAEVVPKSRIASVLTHDRARDRIVMYGAPYGDNVTWEWDGRLWSARYTDPFPVTAFTHGLVFDDTRRTTWLFDFGSRQTWSYDGRGWTQTGAPMAPSYRENPVMVFDRRRGVVVLFGGEYDHHTVLNDTWEWNGSTWTRRQPPVVPPARAGHAMAYDPVAGHVLMFGGSDLQGVLDDTWAWDGTYWIQQQAFVKPSPRWRSAMAFDPVRQRPLLFGGQSGTAAHNDTWEWNGSDWQQLQPSNSPPPQAGAAMATHAGTNRVVLHTGNGGETWGWDGSDWALLQDWPAPRLVDSAAAADRSRDRIVLFGDALSQSGTPQPVPTGTWEWDGQRWLRLQPNVEPPPRGYAAMAHDPVRGVTLLFGGQKRIGLSTQSDTWEWNGSQWVQRFPTTVPQPTSRRISMYHDPSLGQNVLTAEGVLGSANGVYEWRWDGADWQVLGARTDIGAFRGVAYDRARGLPVAVTTLGTFEKVAGQWQQRAGPGPFIGNFNGRGIEFDPDRQRIVAVMWTSSTVGYSVPTWVWDGAAWTSLPAAEGYGLYGPRVLVEDPARGRLALISGNIEATQLWYLTSTPASGESFGSACSGTAGEVTVSARGRPRTGNPAFGIDVDHALPGALVLFGVSLGESNIPLGNGCSWYLGSTIASHVLVASPSGFDAFDLPIPASVAFRGLRLTVQAFALDPGGPHLGSLAVSAGLRLVVGD